MTENRPCDAVIMAVVVIYIRFAGSEALMGEEEEAT